MQCLDVRDFPLPINSQSTHVPRLAGRSEGAIPEDSLRVHLLALRCREHYRYVGELVIPEPDDHVRPAAHSSVHRTVPQEQAESRVMRICRHAPDGIARIDVLDVYFRTGLFKVLLGRVSQKRSDVSVPDVPGSVVPGRSLYKILACSFRQDKYDDGRDVTWSSTPEARYSYGNGATLIGRSPRFIRGSSLACVA